MEQIDERLRQLLVVVLQQPEGSKEYDRALNRLLILLQGLPDFRKFAQPGCPDYFLEALNRTWEWFSQNVKNFKPRTSSIQADLVKWIKSYFYWRLKDATDAKTSESQVLSSLDIALYLDDSQNKTTYLEQVAQQGHLLGTPSNLYVLDGIESLIEQVQCQEKQEVALKLRSYIETDPQEKLRTCYPRYRPLCNCQTLSIRRYLKDPPDTFAALAREYMINYQTLNGHWKQKAIPLLRAIAIELGYQPEP
jgi:hypothetical protein